MIRSILTLIVLYVVILLFIGCQPAPVNQAPVNQAPALVAAQKDVTTIGADVGAKAADNQKQVAKIQAAAPVAATQPSVAGPLASIVNNSAAQSADASQLTGKVAVALGSAADAVNVQFKSLTSETLMNMELRKSDPLRTYTLLGSIAFALLGIAGIVAGVYFRKAAFWKIGGLLIGVSATLGIIYEYFGPVRIIIGVSLVASAIFIILFAIHIYWAEIKAFMLSEVADFWPGMKAVAPPTIIATPTVASQTLSATTIDALDTMSAKTKV